MRAIPLAIALTLVTACQDAAVTPGPLPLDGDWRQSGDLRDVATGDGHIHLGTYTLVGGIGGAFTGQGEQGGICSTPDGATYEGPLVNEGAFPIMNGQVLGNAISFDTDLCHFEGTFTDASRTRMTGTARCSYVQDGQTYQFEGQWQADR